MVRSNLLSGVFWERVYGTCRTKVDKYSYINENINFFCNIGQDHPLTNNQVYSNDEFDFWPVYSGERFRALGLKVA